MPVRYCLNSTGRGELSLTAAAMARQTGRIRMDSSPPTTRSSARLIQRIGPTMGLRFRSRVSMPATSPTCWFRNGISPRSGMYRTSISRFWTAHTILRMAAHSSGHVGDVPAKELVRHCVAAYTWSIRRQGRSPCPPGAARSVRVAGNHTLRC